MFNTADRLFSIELGAKENTFAIDGLLVKSWAMREALNQPYELVISALSINAFLDVNDMLGKPLCLSCTLPDGTKQARTGIVVQAMANGADGGFAQYELTVQPWLALLAYTQRSQVWQECSVEKIIDSVFSLYSSQADWRWEACAKLQLSQSAAGGIRSYTVQYRESDLEFVERLLAREGLITRLEENESAPGGHTLVLLADTTSPDACPDDASQAKHGSIRFHRASSQEQSDAIQTFNALRSLKPASSAVLTWDYVAKRAVSAEAQTAAQFAGNNAPRWDALDTPTNYAAADKPDAQRLMVLSQQALEARHKLWFGQSTVRTFTSGTQFTLSASQLDLLESDNRFLITQVVHAGVNNLPKEGGKSDGGKNTQQVALEFPSWVPAATRAQAERSGYGNNFEALRAYVPWRALLLDDTGALLRPSPTAQGPLTATVMGPSQTDSESDSNRSSEIFTDALGRIRIQFDFQKSGAQGPDTSTSSTWVRVMQRWANGNQTGWQFIPRIGQEVLVGFFDGDIERPYVMGALYNGQGEASPAPTPGGKDFSADADARQAALKASTDHAPSAQANLIGDGHSPAWHGAAPLAATKDAKGQNNASALNGIKTQEFAGAGFNQLVFDDTPQQLRTQLATTAFATQLNLGHLIHQADNHRGSLRGQGFELRTDAYGAVRAGKGVHITTHATQAQEPAGDNAPGMALLKQLKMLSTTFGKSATTHQTTALPAFPYEQALKAVSTMVEAKTIDGASGDAAEFNTNTGSASDAKVPHAGGAPVTLSARAGSAAVAGQDIVFNAGSQLTTASGEHTELATGGTYRLHTGQSIGVLAGVIAKGDGSGSAAPAGTGIGVVAAKGKVKLEAQSDTLTVAAKGNVSIQSQSAHIDWAAAKKISLSTAGGANITIEGGNITVQGPGKILVKAATKQFAGGTTINREAQKWPDAKFDEQFVLAWPSGDPIANRKYRVTREDGTTVDGVTDAQGKSIVIKSALLEQLKIELLPETT
jgi:type VI secretion system secreted protein VgrG